MVLISTFPLITWQLVSTWIRFLFFTKLHQFIQVHGTLLVGKLDYSY
jgi:hypothetical protein